MSDFLSQDDIDALLESEVAGGGENSGSDGGSDKIETIIGDLNKQQSSVINTLIGKEITFEISEVIDGTAPAEKLEDDGYVAIDLNLSGGAEGTHTIFLGKKSVAHLADLMVMGDGSAEFNAEEHLDAIKELFSAVNGGYATDLGEKVGSTVNAGDVVPHDNEGSETADGRTVLVQVKVEGGESFPMVIVEDTHLFATLNKAYGGGSFEPEEKPQNKPFDDDDDLLSQDELDSLTTAADSMGSRSYEEDPEEPHRPRVKPASAKNIDMLLDIDLDVSIELGSTDISIKRVLDMAPGSTIELDNFAGEPVNLLVNEKVVAKGEVVVVDENFGVRIISLVSPEERIKSLR
ncbi:MAG: flagellar motor switch protein FliN [Fibrobacterota bacterium]